MRTRIYRSIFSRLLTTALITLGWLGTGISADPVLATGTTSQTITVTTAPTTLNLGETANISAVSSAGLPVDIATDDVTCSLGPGYVRAERIGSCLVYFDQPGDSNYAPAQTVYATITILGPTNVISTNTLLSVRIGETGQIVATVTSGLRITYYVTQLRDRAPNCSVNSTGLVTALNIGSCQVVLSSDASIAYPAPPAVTVSVTVIGQPQASLNLTLPYGLAPGESGTVSVSGGSGSGVTTITASGDCTLNGNTVTANNSGSSCTISVTKAGDSTYAAASTSQTFSIASVGGSGGSGGTNPYPSATPYPASSADSGDIVFALDQEATKKAKPSLDAFDVQAATGGIMIFKGRNLLSVLSVTVGNNIPVKILKSTDAEIDLEMPKAALAGWQTIMLKTSVGEKSYEKAVNYLAPPAKAVVKILKGFKTGQAALAKSQKVGLKKFVKAVGKYKIVECRGLTKPSMMTCKYLKTIYKAGRVKVTKLKLKPASAAAKQVRLVFSR